MPAFINDPVNRLMERWGKLPWAIQLFAWPVVCLISILNIVVTLPEIAWHLLKPRQPIEIKLLERSELIEWVFQLESRFNSMLKINPPECHDVLRQPRDDVREIMDSIAESEPDRKLLKVRADELAVEYEQWKGEPPSQVYFLCLHVSKWCDAQDAR